MALNPKLPGLWHGGDYNPEQWPRETWREDVRLMREAGVNVVTLGVFSWVSLEPREGEFAWDWLDEITGLLGENGIRFVLATPSAAPPAWMARRYPEILRVGPDRVRRRHGNRVNYCFSSALYRSKAAGMARRLAERYGAHPGLVMWHVSNEYAGESFSPEAEASFRRWLRAKYGSLDALNAAWGTAFWGHTYGDWEEIEAPGGPYGEVSIDGLSLDWRRFVSDEIVGFFDAESAPLRELAPDVPITTNLMGFYETLDSWRMAERLDVVSWDSYPYFTSGPEEARSWTWQAFTHDLHRSLKRKPFLLIESTPGSSNWYPTMTLRRPGELRAESLLALAHGADGVMYFQWRQSRGGQEKLHGAVVEHGFDAEGERGDERPYAEGGNRTFDAVREIGALLAANPEIAGGESRARCAVVLDWASHWALNATCGPFQRDKGYLASVVAFHGALARRGIACDLVPPHGDLSGYDLVAAPMLYALSEADAGNLRAFVRSGGTLVATYLTAHADENALVPLGGFGAAIRDLTGVRVREIDALPVGKEVPFTFLGERFGARDLCELATLEGAEALGEYAGEFYAGLPAVARHGRVYTVLARGDDAFHDRLVAHLAEGPDLRPDVAGRFDPGVVARRRGDAVVVVNTRDRPATFSLVGERERELGPYGGAVLAGVAAR